jgi:hypothetical protein
MTHGDRYITGIHLDARLNCLRTYPGLPVTPPCTASCPDRLHPSLGIHLKPRESCAYLGSAILHLPLGLWRKPGPKMDALHLPRVLALLGVSVEKALSSWGCVQLSAAQLVMQQSMAACFVSLGS